MAISHENSVPKKAGKIQGIIVILIGLLPMMAIVVLMPVVPALRDNFKDVPYILTLAPLVLSAPGLCIALFSPYAGYLTDKLGRRGLLQIFMFLYGIGGILPFFLDSFTALFGGRLILGIGEAFILTISNTLLGDYFNESERSSWLMWQTLLQALFGVSLLSFSGYLSGISWQYPFLIYSFAFILMVGAYFFIFEPKKVNKKALEIERLANDTLKFPAKMVFRITLTTLVAATLYFIYTLHFSLALDEMGITNGQDIGNYSAIASLGIPIGAILFKLISKRSNRFQFACLFILIGIGLIGIGLALNIHSVIASAFVQQLGSGMAIPILIAWALREVPAEFRGRGMGFWTSGLFLGQFISPFAVSGMRMITGDLLSAFVVFGIICIVIAFANWFFGKKENIILNI